mgnify:CR=1 FL=1
MPFWLKICKHILIYNITEINFYQVSEEDIRNVNSELLIT